ncbi:MAG TPA: phosphotransferase [Candidatus Tumulicola sp.]
MEHDVVDEATRGLWRIAGSAAGQLFSTVAKQIGYTAGSSSRWRTNTEQRDPYYWKREYDAYRNGAFGRPGSGVRSATLYASTDRSDGALLFLEDVQGVDGWSWSRADYIDVARKLARYQAAAETRTAARAASTEERFNGLLIEYLRRREFFFDGAWRSEDCSGFPEVDRLRAFAPAVNRLWDDREQLYRTFGEIPATRCHFDFWGPNVFVSADPLEDVVAIDLAHAGVGNLGHDVANLIVDDAVDLLIPTGDIERVWSDAVAAYIEEVLLAIPMDDGRLGRAIELSGALKYAWLFPAMFELVLDDGKLEALEAKRGDVATFLRGRCAALEFVGGLIEGAGSHL